MVGTCYLFCNTRQLAQLYDELLNGTVIKYFSLSLSFGGVLIRPLNREGHFTAKSDTQRRIGHTHTHRDDIQKGKLDARWKGSGNNEEFKRSSASPQTRQQVNAREREREDPIFTAAANRPSPSCNHLEEWRKKQVVKQRYFFVVFDWYRPASSSLRVTNLRHPWRIGLDSSHLFASFPFRFLTSLFWYLFFISPTCF